MYLIKEKKELAENIVLFDVLAPRAAKSALPGQFIILKADETAERVPLTIADYNAKTGIISIVVQAVGESSKKINSFNKGDYFEDFAGPLGLPSELINAKENKKTLFIAGGLGAAPVYVQVKWLAENAQKADLILGARTKDLIIMEEELKAVTEHTYVCTDDGSYGFHGNVTAMLAELIENQGKQYDEAIAIGPLVMMKFSAIAAKKYNLPIIVSMNPIMVDGTGMCGACRVTVGGKVKFACVDGPEFDGALVDFDEAMRRQNTYKSQEIEGKPAIEHAEKCPIPHFDKVDFNKKKRVPVSEQDPKERAKNFYEVNFGYNFDEAKLEASRCLSCKKPKCVSACPVAIDIPKFIAEIKAGDAGAAAQTIFGASNLPAICGRVCPQESQCEGSCIVGIKNEPVAIGRLERFAGDWALKNAAAESKTEPKSGAKVAVIGAGPAGLTCAGTLAKLGYQVKIFESLHEPGGVLMYGIPEFRLPKAVVKAEIENVKKLGVEIETNVIVGKTITIDQLFAEGFKAIFIGSGAGLPKFMNIPGETANGVFSANEYLTRSNLMKAYRNDTATPIMIGKKTAVVGGGNVAMDAARTALRLGSEVHVVYRRSEAELPARLEEVHHAKEEGIIFNLLTNPVEILTNEKGWVSGLKCIKMELGEPDSSGRRRPIEKPGSEFVIEVDAVLMSLGTSPNPLIAGATPGLKVDKYGCVMADDDLATSREGVFVGGDAQTGAATVILAMGAGKKAAASIDKYLKSIN